MEKLTAKTLSALNDDHYRNLAWMEQSEAEVLVHSTEIPGGYTVPVHHHRRTQILCVFRGVVLVATDSGRWMIPPGHALLIPRGLAHAVEMLSDVSMRSLYISPRDGKAVPGAPKVLEVTDLARSLLLEALKLREAPAGHGKARLVYALLLEEMESLPERPLGLPFPLHERLADLCRRYLRNPAPDARIDDWAESLAMSRRTFTRLFREETGLSFVTWRQQACVFASLPKLAEGWPVTHVALEAGYESVPAFTTMFKRMLGTSPRSYSMQH
ncbi:AraC family transcriptional regulator [Metarhizobium album]|uniref:AraC family transcriptional regulator n=1 Tax=Metarhizobium album TaxID=2182425 RepID=A0A2U2DRK4_9HYPH|nr:helix-turn-helix transcriptional regulator [Rhizobium album]PWE55927.1 AraC family transcriptional regulator [Rhizobium album]